MAIYPILRLIYRLLQLKIRPNYDCKLGITRKLAINKRLLDATPSTPTIVPTHPYATKKRSRPFPRPSGKSRHGPKKRSRSLDLLALTFRPRPALWATPWEQPADGGDGAKGADVILSVDS